MRRMRPTCHAIATMNSSIGSFPRFQAFNHKLRDDWSHVRETIGEPLKQGVNCSTHIVFRNSPRVALSRKVDLKKNEDEDVIKTWGTKKRNEKEKEREMCMRVAAADGHKQKVALMLQET